MAGKVVHWGFCWWGMLGMKGLPACSGQVCHPLALWQSRYLAASISPGLSGLRTFLCCCAEGNWVTGPLFLNVLRWRPHGMCSVMILTTLLWLLRGKEFWSLSHFIEKRDHLPHWRWGYTCYCEWTNSNEALPELQKICFHLLTSSICIVTTARFGSRCGYVCGWGGLCISW